MRHNGIMEKFRARPDPDMLFWAGCRTAELMVEFHKPTLSVAWKILEEASPELVREIGIEEVRRIIGNAFACVEKEELEGV